MSDYRIAFEEAFRFEELIQSLRLPEEDPNTELIGGGGGGAGVGVGTEDDGVWEARTASLVLVNALTNCPESLEERVMLREEFGRRGLNEVIVVRVHLFLLFCQNAAHTMLNVARMRYDVDPPLRPTSRLARHTTRRVHRRKI